jgi:acyl-CoA thioester hydrolase
MTHLFQVNIFYEDTDFAGIVYHANYLKFIERARSRAISHVGISQRDLKSKKMFFVVRKLSADFFGPAYFEDRLLVITGAKQIKNASVTLQQDIFKGSEKIFSATVKLALVSSSKPVRLSNLIREKLNQLRL